MTELSRNIPPPIFAEAFNGLGTALEEHNITNSTVHLFLLVVMKIKQLHVLANYRIINTKTRSNSEWCPYSISS